MGLRMELHYLASAGMSAAKAVKSWGDHDHDGDDDDDGNGDENDDDKYDAVDGTALVMLSMMMSGDGWSQGREILGHGEEKDYEGVLGGWPAPVIAATL